MKTGLVKALFIAPGKRLLSHKGVDAYSVFKFLRLWKTLKLKEKDILLDLGGGQSILSRIFSERVYSYINIDLQPQHYRNQLVRARENAGGALNVFLIQGDAQCIPL